MNKLRSIVSCLCTIVHMGPDTQKICMKEHLTRVRMPSIRIFIQIQGLSNNSLRID